MAEPVQREPKVNEGLDQIFEKLLGVKDLAETRDESIRNDVCIPPPMGCGGPATEFRDDLSRKDFAILGMCQNCQDKVDASFEALAGE